MYRSFWLNSSTFAVSKITSGRWWCIESLFPRFFGGARHFLFGRSSESPADVCERLAECGWKPDRYLLAQTNLSMASTYWYMHATESVTVSSNSRFQTVLFQQHSANLSDLGLSAPCWTSASLPIPLLRLSLLRLLDANFQGSSLWAWEFHPLILKLCLGQTL